MKIRCVAIQHVLNKYGKFVWNVEFAARNENQLFPMGQIQLTYDQMTNFVVGEWYYLSLTEVVDWEKAVG